MTDKFLSLPGWLNRGIVDIFPAGNTNEPNEFLGARLEEAVKHNRPLRIKLGIDPTSTSIHLGHSILFRKLRSFQDAGHTAVLIIGDFTAQIGDPTGKSSTRVQLTSEEVEANSVNYLKQLGKDEPPERSLLDFATPGRLEVYRNSEWLSEISLPRVIDLLSTATVGQMLAKEDFGTRFRSGTSISLHEFLYPLLQGYDSVAVKADVELGGTDQKFNVTIGRDLQRYFGQRPQFGLLLPILIGLDGVQKMSKSLGNTVTLDEDPISMYSKLEKVPDELVDSYITLLTDLNKNNLPSEPRELQKAMALAVTASRHGIKVAKEACNSAASLVSGSDHGFADVPEVSLGEINFPAKVFYLLSAIGMSPSSSEARRQIQGGAVRLDGEKIVDPNHEFIDSSYLLGKVIQIGKKKFLRLSR
ncbi:tyrosine--tRNA ligase [Prochlorococcus sp. MIT 1300]|uniref:tyrosine--tRNA ligase n=1 Tax=Prochlorococcus sp. MIT 1300 TaxID=3096218 RepID=UPI002A757A95|nr:tyrosine--tRNA ligase [Prochlorococcus sp. MIT 1300]